MNDNIDMGELRKLRDKLNRMLEEEKETREDKVTVGKLVDSTVEILRDKKENFISSVLSKANKAQKRREIEKEIARRMAEVEENIRKDIPKE